MTSTAIITVEGVLSSGNDLRNAQPHKEARQLWMALRSQFRIIALSRATPDIAKWWLRTEGMYDRNWAQVRCWNEGNLFSWEVWRYQEIRNFLADGWEIGMVLDHSANLIEMVRSLHVPTMWVSYPDKAVGWKNPEETAPRPWADVASSVVPNQEVNNGSG